jgi:hypothetical protein
MRLLSLKTAAIEIRQAREQGTRQKLPSPFFFMVGAGISCPPLPLAASIQADCVEEARRYGTTEPLEPGAPNIERYSHWFEKAYPQPENRQRYLRKLMEGKAISRANFRLAHLLLEKTITNLVLTTNFDDFASRALTLFGQPHIVCDHPGTLERIDLRAEDVQIIHIHGTYWFYDCCNLKAEISERASASSTASLTMLSVVNEILHSRSPLVIGYSGWEGDVFMSALKRRTTRPLRTNLYWFCHTKREADSLPQWLVETPGFRAVVPEHPTSAHVAESRLPITPAPPKATRDAFEARGFYLSSGFSPDGAILDASTVFDELIRGFNLITPSLTSDPLGFFSGHLKASLLSEGAEEVENDIYAIRSVIARLERLKELERTLPPPSRAEELLESFRNAVRQSDHRRAVRIAGSIPIDDLTDAQLRELSSSLADSGPALNDKSDEELSSYDLILLFSRRLEEAGQIDLATKLLSARALPRKGLLLGATNRSEGAIEAYDEVVRRFSDAPEPALCVWVAAALLQKGVQLVG